MEEGKKQVAYFYDEEVSDFIFITTDVTTFS
jgi:hypothetical protein